MRARRREGQRSNDGHGDQQSIRSAASRIPLRSTPIHPTHSLTAGCVRCPITCNSTASQASSFHPSLGVQSISRVRP